MNQFGGYEILTSTLHPRPTPRSDHANFESRQFETRLSDNAAPYVLRYAADHGHMNVLASYAGEKEAPETIRVWEYGTFFRRYQSGEVGGLARLREFHQLDHHTLCAQGEEVLEFGRLLRGQLEAMNAIGLAPYVEVTVMESEYPSIQPIVEEVSLWMGAPILVETLATATNYWAARSFIFVPGPFRTANLQLDRSAVEGADRREGPVVIHCTLSSPERLLLAIGNQAQVPGSGRSVNGWPFWLAPTQLRLVPTDVNVDVESLSTALVSNGLRVDVDDRRLSLSSRVLVAHQDGIAAVVVVGERELAQRQFNLRLEGKLEAALTAGELIGRLSDLQGPLPRRPELRPPRRLQYWRES